MNTKTVSGMESKWSGILDLNLPEPPPPIAFKTLKGEREVLLLSAHGGITATFFEGGELRFRAIGAAVDALTRAMERWMTGHGDPFADDDDDGEKE